MSNIVSIDRSRCVRCGRCVGVCPCRVISSSQNGDGSIEPVVRNDFVQDCILCGHCVAVCPTSALSVRSPENLETFSLDRSKFPNFEQISSLVRGRRSIRKFKKEPVAQDLLDRLFDLVRWAPSAKNQLPLRWTVVNDAKIVRELAQTIVEELPDDPKYRSIVDDWNEGNDGIHRGSPCLVFATMNVDYKWTVDAAIAVETMDLAATTLGLGTCWAGLFMIFAAQNKKLRHRLKIADDEQVGGALLLGYPDGEIYEKYPWRPECPVEYID